MSIDVKVTGKGAFYGSSSAITQYSVQEGITPLRADQGSPGAGTITFGAIKTDDSVLLMDNAIELSDGARGKIQGTVRSIGAGDYPLTVTSDSVVVLLNSKQTALPFAGRLDAAMAYYLGLCGITGTAAYEVDASIAARAVSFPGFYDVVLDKLSQICVAQRIEMSVVYDNIVFRPARTNTAVEVTNDSSSFAIDRGSPALAVECYYYQYASITNGVIFPNIVTAATTGIQVDPGQTLAPITFALSACLGSVNQPVVADYVNPPPYVGTAGTYMVLGNDDLPIPAAEWTAKGGKLLVAIDPADPTNILVTVTGMSEPGDARAPYRVGIVDSEGNFTYPGLYITGTGLSYNKQKVSVGTGAKNTQVAVGVTIDNPMINTLADALTAMEKTVLAYSGVNYTITGTAVAINRAGTGNAFATSLLSVFDSEFAGQKLSALNAKGWKFSDFDAHYAAFVTDSFPNQLFGNASGSRILRGLAYFRTDTATTTESSVSFSATLDTIMSDWNAAWSGKKLAAWDARFATYKMRDWNLRPLWSA